jgi:hypothetical protein
VPSERAEILLNINPACGKGYVNPNAGLRVGEWKLLVDCFNTTTLAPTNDKVELYNVGTDPFETTDLAATHPKVVQELMVRLSVYAQSADQAPPHDILAVRPERNRRKRSAQHRTVELPVPAMLPLRRSP